MNPPRPDGPLDCKLLFVGEAPGVQEMKQGIPFCGPTGKAVRGVLRRAGLDCKIGSSQDVRFTNVIPTNPGTIPANQLATLAAKHWDNITPDLEQTTAKVIVACGGMALLRLTGLTNINEQHGSVIPAGHLPAPVTLAGRGLRLGLPDCLLISCLHPAGIMRTPLRSDWVRCLKALERAASYAKGKVYKPEIVGEDLKMTSIFWGRHQKAFDILSRSKTVVLDTEFDPDTREVFTVQFLGDASPKEVFWIKPKAWNLLDKWATLIADKELVAHYHPAELQSLQRVGIDLRGARWFDTMLAWTTLYPDCDAAIQHPTMYYCDNERYWKDLNTLDPVYMAKDVRNCYRIYKAMQAELASCRMLDLFYDEVMPSMALTERMESEGLEVDTELQRHMLAENEDRCLELLVKLRKRVPFSNKMQKKDTTHLTNLVEESTEPRPVCELHPQYNGVRGKKFAADDSCICKLIYEWVTEKIGRETPRAFKPTNPHDLRWLLYEHWKLPKQKPAKGSKAPSTGADAIQRLTMQIEMAFKENKTKSKYYRADAEEIVAFLQDSKELQHLEKMRSTFLQPPVDDRNVAHPPHRLWGTGTGRLAGGADDSVSASQYSFNPLNIPGETRKLFKADNILLGDARWH